MSLKAKFQFQALFPSVAFATATLTPAAVTTGTTNVASTITVPGAAVGDLVFISPPAALGNVHLQGEVTAADTVTLKFANTTAGSITPPAGAYKAIVFGISAVTNQ